MKEMITMKNTLSVAPEGRVTALLERTAGMTEREALHALRQAMGRGLGLFDTDEYTVESVTQSPDGWTFVVLIPVGPLGAQARVIEV